MEQWNATGYNGIEVSTHGRVRTTAGRILRTQSNHTVNITISRGHQIKVSVPRMMYNAFIGDIGPNYVLVEGDLLIANLVLHPVAERASRARGKTNKARKSREKNADRIGMAKLLSMPWGSACTYSVWTGGW